MIFVHLEHEQLEAMIANRRPRFHFEIVDEFERHTEIGFAKHAHIVPALPNDEDQP